MTHRVVGLSFVVCVFGVLTACASSPKAAAEADDDMPSWVDESPAQTERPAYHDESDARMPDRATSRDLAAAVCGASPHARDCRRAMKRSIRVYEGSFSEPAAEEMLVAAESDAVLVRRENGAWSRVSQLRGVDIEHCLIAAADADVQSLLCRVPAAVEDGFKLEFAQLSVADDGALSLDKLALPTVTDIDTVLFAGWKKSDSGIELRVHDADKVRGAKTLDLSGHACRHRTFLFDAVTGELTRRKTCTTEATADQGADSDTAYESRLDDPIMNHNRKYVMCYRRELDRLRNAIETRDKRVRMCEAGTAPEEVDCEAVLADSEEAADRNTEGAKSDRDDELRDPSEVRGRIKTRIVLGSPGTPVACQVTESTIDSGPIEQCLCRELMKTDFPPVPDGSFFDVTYPFDFSPDLAR